MIIFISNPEYARVIRESLGLDILVYNLSSLYSGFESISNLITNIGTFYRNDMTIPDYVNSINFDQAYANKILQEPELFHSFMLIVYGSYLGFAVCVLVQRDPYRDAIMESIIKLIQQRYGINSWIVEDIEDIYYLSESYPTPYGLVQLDQDIKAHGELYSKGLVNQFINSNISVE